MVDFTGFLKLCAAVACKVRISTKIKLALLGGNFRRKTHAKNNFWNFLLGKSKPNTADDDEFKTGHFNKNNIVFEASDPRTKKLLQEQQDYSSSSNNRDNNEDDSMKYNFFNMRTNAKYLYKQRICFLNKYDIGKIIMHISFFLLQEKFNIIFF